MPPAAPYGSDRTVIDRTPYGYGNAPAVDDPHGASMQPPYQPQPYQQPSYQGYDTRYAQPPYGNPATDQYAGTAAPQQPYAAPQPAREIETRYCPECDAELPAGATICPVCHTAIEIQTETIEITDCVCPDCGSEVDPQHRFCHNCGTRLRVDNVVVAAPQPVAPAQPQPVQSAPQPGSTGKFNFDKPQDTAAHVSVPQEDAAPMPAPQPTVAPETADDDTVPAGPLHEPVPQCRLQRLTAGDLADGQDIISCTGTEVDLYRGNTDPANNTIARDLQARLTFADGKWCIEDCSALRTTYIRPGRKIELNDGDVIVMGNREFIFKT